MRLSVTELGPVHEAEINLSAPLIILTGPNNSGKTYLGWVTYSLARAEISEVRCPEQVKQIAKQLVSSPDQTVAYGTFAETFQEAIQAIADSTCEHLANDFGAPEGRFSRTKLQLRLTDKEPSGAYGPPTRGGTHVHPLQGTEILLFSVGGAKLRIDVYIGERKNEDDKMPLGRPIYAEVSKLSPALKEEIETALSMLLLRRIKGMHFEHTVAFPVERMAISLFARELAANRTELVDELISEDFSRTAWLDSLVKVREHLQHRVELYPRVIRDALQTAIRSERPSALGPFSDLADELEGEILGGKIKVSDQGNLEFTPASDPAGVALRLHETASVVKSLGSLVLHLRYYAKPHQRVFIDEPELNLHPDNQRRIARIIAKAVNRGLHATISTHSDYVIRELNNLIMLAQHPERARLTQELGYESSAILSADKVGVYLVKGGVCRSLAVENTGFEVPTIDEAAEHLNRDTQAIFLGLSGE